MTDKINGPGVRPTDPSGVRRAESAKPTTAATAAGGRRGQEPSEGDTVQLTASARLLGKLEAAIRELPAVDGERVGALREALATGHYRADPHAIADKLFAIERELDR